MSKSKILIVHRQYRNSGGEDAFLEEILKPAMDASGLEFDCLILPPLSPSTLKNCLEISGMVLGFERLRPSLKSCLGLLKADQFTHVIFNNYLPTISLQMPQLTKAYGLKTLMWVHNFRLDCANGLHFDGKSSCNRCLNSGSRWAFFLNCQKNWIQSLIYFFIYRRQRVARFVVPHIDHFICNSEFTRASLQKTLNYLKLEGTSSVISMPTLHPVNVSQLPPKTLSHVLKTLERPFYLYLGRVSFHKGADIFLDLAKKNPEKCFLMCGDGPMIEELKSKKSENLEFGGVVGKEEKNWLFKNCEALIVTSRTPETSSLVISESRPYNTPIVYPRGGGAEETFKALGCVGCSLDEFVGQSFSRNESQNKALGLEDFARSLKNCLAAQPPKVMELEN